VPICRRSLSSLAALSAVAALILTGPAFAQADAGVLLRALQDAEAAAQKEAARAKAAPPAPAKATGAAATAADRQRKKTKLPTPVAPPAPKPICEGDYANAVPAPLANKDADTAPKDVFVFAIRSVSTYERVYYGKDGKLRKQYLRAQAHGTGFGLRVVNGETLLVTNEHVASRPDVTDEEHTVEGIPPGAKKVREQLKIVRDESDDYEPGHIPLVKVLSDPASDIAILKAKTALPVMPYRIGRSGALRAGNQVQVRGFPLGAFRAVSSGKVINPYTEDSDRAWSHSDFVIDALLSGGNSGSPVFAVSCRTGELELVGVYHAGYTDAAALNVVVAVDQLKEEFETLRLPKRDQAGARVEITAADRDKIVQELNSSPSRKLVIPFGGRAVEVSLREPQLLRFSVLEEEFPLGLQETLALIDHSSSGFGTLDSVAWTVDDLPVEVGLQSLDADSREHFERLYDQLWHQLLAVDEYRVRAAKGRASADAFAAAQGVRARLKKKLGDQKELLGLCAYDADRAGLPAKAAAQEETAAATPAPVPASAPTPAAAPGPAAPVDPAAGAPKPAPGAAARP
jgi:serine protease Do